MKESFMICPKQDLIGLKQVKQCKMVPMPERAEEPVLRLEGLTWSCSF